MREKLPILNRPLRVMHIISGDLWAGAEAQAFTLLKHLNNRVSLQVIIMNDGELFRRLKELKIPVTLLPESQLSSAKIFIQLTKLINEFKPDVLHTHRQKENILGNFANLLALIFFNKPAKSVRTTHGAPEFSPKGKQKIQVWLDNWVGKYLQQGIIAVSNELAEKLAYIFPTNKIHVIHNGVDCQALQALITPADFRQKAPDHKHIGIIGRIEPVKRIDIFIEMANSLLKDESVTQPLKFHVIGEGSLRPAMEATVKKLGLSDHIYFHGHRRDMASCVSSIDAIVMCSDHEGTPMTALEALALETPIIAHNTGGLKTILENYPELLVHNHAPQGYAEKVKHLVAQKNIFIALPEIYTADKNLTDTLGLYTKLVQC